MLDNTMTIQVDQLGNDVLVAETYERFDSGNNFSLYRGENHSMESRDLLGFYRTFPKPSGNFKGVARSSFKFTTDKVVTGVDGLAQLTAPIIIEVSFSKPVGVTDADLLHARERVAALLQDQTVMRDLNVSLDI